MCISGVSNSCATTSNQVNMKEILACKKKTKKEKSVFQELIFQTYCQKYEVNALVNAAQFERRCTTHAEGL